EGDATFNNSTLWGAIGATHGTLALGGSLSLMASTIVGSPNLILNGSSGTQSILADPGATLSFGTFRQDNGGAAQISGSFDLAASDFALNGGVLNLNGRTLNDSGGGSSSATLSNGTLIAATSITAQGTFDKMSVTAPISINAASLTITN